MNCVFNVLLQWCTVIPEMAYFCWAKHSNKMFLHHFLANKKYTDRAFPVCLLLWVTCLFTHWSISGPLPSSALLLLSRGAWGSLPAYPVRRAIENPRWAGCPDAPSRCRGIPHSSVLSNGMMDAIFFISNVFKRYFLIRILMCFFIQRTSWLLTHENNYKTKKKN